VPKLQSSSFLILYIIRLVLYNLRRNRSARPFQSRSWGRLAPVVPRCRPPPPSLFINANHSCLLPSIRHETVAWEKQPPCSPWPPSSPWRTWTPRWARRRPVSFPCLSECPWWSHVMWGGYLWKDLIFGRGARGVGWIGSFAFSWFGVSGIGNNCYWVSCFARRPLWFPARFGRE
jgi:hypothetical protein